MTPLSNFGTTKAFGLSIDAFTYSSGLWPSRLPYFAASAASSSRFGPIVAFEPASASVWQALHPVSVKSALPAAAWSPPAAPAPPPAALWVSFATQAS